MNYIVFDLEFNSGKNRKNGNSINEIIEFGAVKLDESLNEIGSFSRTVRPVLTVRLNPYVKKLTNITDSELKSADSFKNAVRDFFDWCSDDCIFSSWSNTDLYVLLENFAAYDDTDTVKKIKKYFDMQKFVTRSLEKKDNNQISLKSASESFSISTERFNLHRAEDDSRVCCELFRRCFDRDALREYITDTTGENYFARLAFKPHYLTDYTDKRLDRQLFFAKCPYCKIPMKRISKTVEKFSAFNTHFICPKCRRNFLLQIRAKVTFDGLETKKKLKEIIPEERKQSGQSNKR